MTITAVIGRKYDGSRISESHVVTVGQLAELISSLRHYDELLTWDKYGNLIITRLTVNGYEARFLSDRFKTSRSQLTLAKALFKEATK